MKGFARVEVTRESGKLLADYPVWKEIGTHVVQRDLPRNWVTSTPPALYAILTRLSLPKVDAFWRFTISSIWGCCHRPVAGNGGGVPLTGVEGRAADMFAIAVAVVLELWLCSQSASVLGQCFGDCRKSTKALIPTHVGC